MGYELHCGDCVEVMRGMADASVDAIVCDPPYGIAYQSARRTDKLERFDILEGDTELDFTWLDEAWRVLRDESPLFVFCRWDTQEPFRAAIAKRFAVRSQVIWDRGVHGLGDLKAQYAPCHDVAWFATKGKYEFPNGRPKSIYRVDRLPANELLHPTQKPLPLMKWIIGDLTKPGDTVLDCFAGSGTTIVACMQMDRNSVGIEKDVRYHAIATKRISDAAMQMPLFAP